LVVKQVKIVFMSRSSRGAGYQCHSNFGWIWPDNSEHVA
jgi:hypothetical protein